MSDLNRYQRERIPGSTDFGIWDNGVADFLYAKLPFDDSETPVAFGSQTVCDRIVRELNALHDKNVD